MARDFRKIKAWEHAHQLTLEIYRASATFPAEEKFGITSQLRRAAASVGANIAEGSSRTSHADFLRFLEISLGSLRETENFLLLARDLGLLPPEVHVSLAQKVDEAARTLSGLIAAVRQN